MVSRNNVFNTFTAGNVGQNPRFLAVLATA